MRDLTYGDLTGQTLRFASALRQLGVGRGDTGFALSSRIPDLNGHWIDGAFSPSQNIHLGVAVSLRMGGLVAPAILDADQLAIDELMVSLTDLVARARSGRLRSSEMSDATVTVTSLGDHGGLFLLAVDRLLQEPEKL